MQRVVIYRLGSLGDTVVALPCFHAIARAFPDHERLVLTNVPVSSKAAALNLVLGESGLIHGTVDYSVGLRSLSALQALRQRLRALKADTLIYLAAVRGRPMITTVRDVLFFRSCGFSDIIGIPSREDLRGPRVDPVTGEEEPEACRLVRRLTALEDIALDDPRNWDLILTRAELDRAAEALAPLNGQAYISVNMGGKDASKDWGAQNWVSTLRRMHETGLWTGAVVVLGAGDDAARARGVLEAIPQPGLDLSGVLKPRESGAVAARGQFFMGHDSGPMHLAAAMGVRTVALFGRMNRPRRWHPFGNGHEVLHRVEGVEHIGVDDVVAAVGRLVAGPTRAASGPISVTGGA